MPEKKDVLISVRHKFAEGMRAGTKRVELRRRAPRLPPGTRVWIYNKAPKAEVTALAILDFVDTRPPSELWDAYNHTLGLELGEFNDYLAGKDVASALVFETVAALPRPVSLAELRGVESKFQPPQFYLRLEFDGGIRRRLRSELPA